MRKEAAIELAAQRAALIAQITIGRIDLAQKGASLRFAAQVIDGISDGIQHIKRHPEILLLPLAVTVVFRPRRLLTLGISGFGIWRLLRSWRRRILS